MRQTTHATIRSFRRKDANDISRMMKELASFHGDAIRANPNHFIKHCLSRKKIARAWIALRDKQAAGFLVAYDRMNFVNGQKTCVIDLLYVNEAFRRQSVGQALLAAAAQDAIRHGCETFLVTAQPGNATANNFYEKLGLNRETKTSARYRCDKDGIKKLARHATPQRVR
ncbi:MAG: GNAT family N-acetyltransferase [Bdellovibrionales bacterium]